MIAWVTGASSGLGFHIALALREAGHTVIAGARSFTDEDVVGIRHLPLDVTDQGSVDAFAEAALRYADGVDAVIHCAGILTPGSCEETTPEEYAHVLDTDFLGVVRVNRAALPRMRQAGRGRIVLLSSINGVMGIPFQSAYTAAKHAMEGYAECLQQEVRAFGIQVCLVEPGDLSKRRGGHRPRRAARQRSGGAGPEGGGAFGQAAHARPAHHCQPLPASGGVAAPGGAPAGHEPGALRLLLPQGPQAERGRGRGRGGKIIPAGTYHFSEKNCFFRRFMV